MAKKGMDISVFQGDITWSKVTGIDFAIIRAGYGSNNIDSKALRNIQGCKDRKIPFGLYWFSYALSTSDATKEADYVCDIADKYKLTFPVIAYDWEYDSDSYATKCGVSMTNDKRYQFAQAFLKRVKQRGYTPIIYTNYDYLNKGFKALLSEYDVWFAYPSGSTKPDIKGLTIWQYSWKGSVPGINADVDMNYCYKDYAKSGSSSSSTPASSTTSNITEAQLRQKVANQANAWLGAVEGDSTHAEILKIYNSQNPLPVGYKMQTHDAWCAAFVSAVWLKVGIAQYITTECGCGRFRDNAKKLGIWVENDAYTPKVGDAIIYYWSDSGSGDCQTGADHIGLVTAVSGNTFTVTEGNTGSGVVGKRTIQVNGRYIRGFIAPDYATIAKKVAGKVTPDSSSGGSGSGSSSSGSIPDITYRVKAGGKWLPAVKNLTDYAGIVGKAITDVAIKASKGTLKYRVHVKGGGWLPYVTGYDTSDYNNGYAGNGKAIDAIEVYYFTPADVIAKNGYLRAKYRVSPVNSGYYSYQYDNEKSNGQDGYAGSFGKTIDRLQVTLSK